MESQVAVENRSDLPEADFLRLVKVLSLQRVDQARSGLAAKHTPPLELTDMVTQDEFSHDFLVSYPGELWLVYDST